MRPPGAVRWVAHYLAEEAVTLKETLQRIEALAKDEATRWSLGQNHWREVLALAQQALLRLEKMEDTDQ